MIEGFVRDTFARLVTRARPRPRVGNGAAYATWAFVLRCVDPVARSIDTLLNAIVARAFAVDRQLTSGTIDFDFAWRYRGAEREWDLTVRLYRTADNTATN